MKVSTVFKAFSRAEDRPTPKEVYNYRVYCSALIIAFGGAMIGYDNGFVGGSLALPSFLREFGLDTISKSDANFITANIASTFQAGCFWGALLVYPLGHYYGHKIGIMISSFVFLIGSVMCCVANSSTGLGVMYAGRIFVGLGVGACSNLGPVYISEIAPPPIRGQLLAFYDIFWQAGGLVGFWINYGVSQTLEESRKQWLIPFAVQFIPGGMLFIGAFFLRDSPRWLMAEKNNPTKALENLRWFRKIDESNEYFKFEVAQIEEGVELRAGTIGMGVLAPIKAILKSKSLLLRLGFSTSLFIWQNASGINAVNYYSPTIFKSLGIDGTDASLLSTGLFGVLKTASVIIWMLFLIETSGRRLTLLIGSTGVSFCMFYLAIYSLVAKPTSHPSPQGSGASDLPRSGQAAMAFFYIWTIFYSASWNWTPWIINTEIFDNNVRSFVQSINAASNWFWSFIMARFTPQMFDKMGEGGYGVYFLFASLSAVGFFFVFFLVPETKGIPLEMVDTLFTKDVPAWKAHKHTLHQIENLRNEFQQEQKVNDTTVD
ncbi:hypothetical protein TRICI_005532 [Trichomonascus ciferrii]|uniref:Quinate transporter n=1 Tax=Trichomonascus ciferrii TaxID=44093 RepID=A0A642US81_9ASCO|nr:hypothetical protein TRICI_005532 [Trichomonascus ciferrii]